MNVYLWRILKYLDEGDINMAASTLDSYSLLFERNDPDLLYTQGRLKYSMWCKSKKEEDRALAEKMFDAARKNSDPQDWNRLSRLFAFTAKVRQDTDLARDSAIWALYYRGPYKELYEEKTRDFFAELEEFPFCEMYGSQEGRRLRRYIYIAESIDVDTPYTQSANRLVFTLGQIPKDIQFPEDHPKVKRLYVLHPEHSNFYFPWIKNKIASFDEVEEITDADNEAIIQKKAKFYPIPAALPSTPALNTDCAVSKDKTAAQETAAEELRKRASMSKQERYKEYIQTLTHK